MTHDTAFARSRLLGLALQLERGDFDTELGGSDKTVAEHWATVIAEHCRQMADVIGGTAA